MSARGKLSLIEALLDGEISLSDKFAERMFQCSSCLQCSSTCPSGVDPAKIINAARAEIVARKGLSFAAKFVLRRVLPFNQRLRIFAKLAGFGLRKFYQRLPLWRMGGMGLSFLQNGKRRKLPDITGACLKDAYPEVVKVASPVLRVLFFTGCMGDMVYQKACSQVINFLSRNRMEILLPKDLPCCGAPLYYSGERDLARETALRSMDTLNVLDPDYIVTTCATCGLMLKEIYPLLLGKEKAGPVLEKILDIHSFIVQKIKLPIKPPPGRKIKVTYHDPCHLVRGLGVREEPRALLKSIPWVDFIEMEGADLCCGGGGAFSFKYYGLALEIAEKKVDAIKKTGAEVVATGCPACQMHISDALSRAGLHIPVVHTTQLLLKGQDT
jgi:glycolate oxidase iron-sulfur subunit